ncbi:MAG: ribosomal-processing cysteine protease Prp [Syntrophomonadaceae bacterium]|nr:ribosomal-processing cysteine protease Prp [Syntrophomonadaceae bacterium]MDD3272077.1 ribosomal-processing cysteine protease Prp [Syntrophomonadaceae bacterium]MDD3897561.1 ribosomal-processing cysteine protease Prp [Syntrophomonadaceae bacterium]MDD4562296.1 ribosomal-processing cysteine protease Prp [Syntrophomonadaceae bacterium]
MIEVRINYQGKDITSFQVKGHAGFAPEGQDIYCAGVSAVAQTTLLGLCINLSIQPEYRVEEGWLQCHLPSGLNREDMENAQIILSTMEAGMLSMQEAYSNFIKLEVRRS